MISQPMANKKPEEIEKDREDAISVLTRLGYEVVNTLFADEWYSQEKMKERGVRQIPLCFLAKSLENMSLCDAVYFAPGWEHARGCIIERQAAEAFIRYTPRSLNEVSKKAEYASGKNLTLEDKLKALHRMTRCVGY